MYLKKEDFEKSALIIAKNLLGSYLVHNSLEGLTVGRIVETECYLGANDIASHAFHGITERNKIMFGPSGHFYIYFTYGMHYCINIVTEKEGIAEAVLIRALEPIKGIELMQHRRHTDNITNLSNGPAKLTQAMGINKKINGLSVESPQLYLTPTNDHSFKIIHKPRIGIKANTDKLWRFYIENNPYISAK